MCNENVFKYQIQEMIPVPPYFFYDDGWFWNSVKLDDSSGKHYFQRNSHVFWNSVKLDDSSGIVLINFFCNQFWNSVKLDDSSGSNYTASKNKK